MATTMPRASRRHRLTREALALFDEITTSETSWSDPRSIDILVRDIALNRLGLEDRARARRVLAIALEGASDKDIADAVEALRSDRDGMLESVAEEYERDLARWRESEPRPPVPSAPAAFRRRAA